MEPKSTSKSKLQVTGWFRNSRVLKITNALFVVLMLALVGLYLVNRPRLIRHVPQNDAYFTVVLDCGSTGSRVNVYKWQITVAEFGKGESDLDLPVLLNVYPGNSTKNRNCQYHCMQTQPGLHNFLGNASGVRASLEPLMSYAKQWVPFERRSVTPVFVLATAGMRKLDRPDARRVLDDVEDFVKEHEFLYKRDWIRVLSGKEEAYYGWVALNYQMGVFRNLSRLPSLGLLDLGGSSLQVVVEVDDEPARDKNVIKSKFGSVERKIAANSLSAFGLNEAFDRSVVMLRLSQALGESTGDIFEIRHPCLGSSYIRNYTCNGCFGLDFRENMNELKSLLLVGEPNWERCKVLARAAAINASSTRWLEQGRHPNCLGLSSDGGKEMLDLISSSHAVARYHALSGFFAVYNALMLDRQANLTKIWESGRQLCSRSWAHQKDINEQYCFRVPYLASLIENALCLSGLEIIFGPGDISWTLGAALIEGKFSLLHSLKSQDGIVTLNLNALVSSPVLLFILLLFLLFVVNRSQIKLPMLGRKAATGSSLPSYLCLKQQPH